MVARAFKAATILCAALAAAGCGNDSSVLENTIRVVVSTDADVPTVINGLTIMGERGGQNRFREDYEVTFAEALPDSFLLHNEQRFDDQGHDNTMPIRVIVAGTLGGATVIRRSAQLKFLNDRPAVLYMPLCAECAGDPCAAQPGTTCRQGSCEEEYVGHESLLEDDGTQPAESDECPSSG
jgi:hypothetical protein